jgi:hypothetical protein
MPVQHSAITVPWALAKLMVFWIKGHIEAHELANGKIPMPPSILPQPLLPVTEELKNQDRNAEAIYAIFNRLREELVAGLGK